MNDFIVTIEDVRGIAYCSRGTRSFFKSHNMDWSVFLKDGLPASLFLNTNDAMAIKVVEQAKIRLGL